MSLADFDALRALIANPYQHPLVYKDLNSGSSNWASAWTLAFTPAAAGIPSTAAATDNSTAGAIQHTNGGSGRQILVGGSVKRPTNSSEYTRPTTLMLIDRLAHQGGLVMNINTLQTTNLPTAALTRYTSGVGVMCAIEIYTSGGSTASRFDVTYTNSGSTGSRLGQLPFASSDVTTATFWQIPLQAGDLGVKSVESVQLSAATSAAGNFGITLYKPLAFIHVSVEGQFDILDNVTWNEEILDDACLQLVYMRPVTGDEILTVLDLAEC